MNTDKTDFNRTKPFYPPVYDKNFSFRSDRIFWAGLIAVFLFMGYGSDKFAAEVDRWRRWERMLNIENLPAHHFHNRGGVLIKKEFVGFEKYHANIGDLMAWYKRAYNIE